MNDLFSLKGKRVVITGGTRGVGRAISLQFARAGAQVLANYVRDTKAAQELQADASKEGVSIDTVRADLSTEKGTTRFLEAVAQRFPTISTFIHCAATGVHRPFTELTVRHFDWTYSLNVRAFFELVHRLLDRFEKGAGILAVSSDGAVRAIPYYTLVGSSKGALESLVRHLAAELAPRGIRVNAIAPGTVLTDAWNVLPDRERRLAEASRRSPTGRLVTLEEVAGAAQFLCSDAASGVIGHTLVVDCGTRIVG
jgi:NAD(P)-dependent dehydrogenase (short-subunit alcohol dehydrogenase family)